MRLDQILKFVGQKGTRCLDMDNGRRKAARLSKRFARVFRTDARSCIYERNRERATHARPQERSKRGEKVGGMGIADDEWDPGER